jgi:hypothetical protein
MNVLIQLAYGLIGAVVVSLIFSFQSSFGEARHTLSIIGAIAILIASGYILRTRLIRWGRRQTWLKCHQSIASFGLCLVLIHSAVQPETWHSWLTFTLALLNFGTGIAVSLTARSIRRILLRCHLILAPILLVSIVVHGREKLDHDEFFPLTEVHDVPCARCHTSPPLLFDSDSGFEIGVDKDGKIPYDVELLFDSKGVSLSQNVTVRIKKPGSSWVVIDSQKKARYSVRQTEAQFSVYADSTYKSYTCLKCHVHNTPEIQFTHKIHGVEPYDRCFICHQTVIDGKKYGNQKANWEYDLEW